MRIHRLRPLHHVSRCIVRSSAIIAAVAVGAVALAGCSAEKSPFRGAAKAVNFATDTPPPAEFVGVARKPGASYIKIERELPVRPSQPRSVDQVKALEKSLEGTRSSNAAAGAAAQAEGRTPAPTPAVPLPPVPVD